MVIHEVEHLLNLSKKSIRYYEEEGLIHPKRERDNSYRIYEEEDIQKLKTIKFLRELNVSIKDLKRLESGEITLKECMEEQIRKVEAQQENYEQVKKLCQGIIDENVEYEKGDISLYLEKMNALSKKGFTMKDRGIDRRKKISGAVISSVVFVAFFLFFIILISIVKFSEEGMPWSIYLFFLALFLFPMVSILFHLVERIREIKSGEEEEASIY